MHVIYRSPFFGHKRGRVFTGREKAMMKVTYVLVKYVKVLLPWVVRIINFVRNLDSPLD